MYEFTPNPEKRREKLLFWILCCLGILLFLFSQVCGYGLSAVFLLSALGALLLALALYVAFALMLRRYTVRILPGTPEARSCAGLLDLTVTEVLGKRVRVVCRIGVEDILHVERLSTRVPMRLGQAVEVERRYCYLSDLCPTCVYALTVRQGKGSVCLLLSADERFEAALDVH